VKESWFPSWKRLFFLDEEDVIKGKFWCYFCTTYHCRDCMFKEKSDLEEFLTSNQSVDQLVNSVFMDKKPTSEELEANEFYFCC
jgi:hypothetical protein